MIKTLLPISSRHAAILAVAGLALAGCSSARQTFGLERSPPDEFQVVARAPLSIPPEFKLRPPQPGATRPQEGNVRDRAASTVFGQSATSPAPFSGTQPGTGTGAAGATSAAGVGQSIVTASAGKPATVPAARGTTGGEAALLSHAGADHADPGIRAQIDQETTRLVVADRHFIDTLMFWHTQAPPGVVVNARQESQRLRENAALGKPVTEGATPVIKRERQAPLEGLFN